MNEHSGHLSIWVMKVWRVGKITSKENNPMATKSF
jgi:hypothetical protein